MTYFPVSSPYQLFADEDGKPLENGYIYVGQSNLNPVTNPITLSWDDAGLYPAAQPVRTTGGYPDRNGSAGELFINRTSYKNYSILVQNKNQETVFFSASEKNNLTEDFFIYSEADMLAAETAGIDSTMGADITLTNNFSPTIQIDTNGYQLDGAFTLDFSAAQPMNLTDECFGSSITITGLSECKPTYWTANTTPGTTSMTSALQKAVDSATSAQGFVKFDAGEYLIDGQIDMTLKERVVIKGVYRQTVLRIDYSGASVFNLVNPGPTYYRGHFFYGLFFTILNAVADIPSTVIKSDYTPEFIIEKCIFINCASVAQVQLNNTFVLCIKDNIFVGDENVGSIYGPTCYQSALGGGSCIYCEGENHSSRIEFNRIRASDAGASSAGIRYGGGDATVITNNAIESNRNRGISIESSCRALRIENNYFEGGTQPFDIYYTSAGTNLNHYIVNNFFNAVQAIEISGAAINNMLVEKNHFDGQALGFNLTGTAVKNGLTIIDNLHNDQGGAQLPWNIAEFPSSLSSIVEPDIEIHDKFAGTGRVEAHDLYVYSKTTLAQNNSWQQYSGSGTAVNSATYLNGLQGYDVTSVDASNMGITCQGFTNYWRDKYITVFVILATSDSRSQSVILDFDAAITYTFACATNTTGRIIRIQRTVPSGATRFYVKFLVGPTLSTLVTLVPTVYLGLHSTPEFYEWR